MADKQQKHKLGECRIRNGIPEIYVKAGKDIIVK